MLYSTDNLVPLKEYTISKRGLRGLAISLPAIWVRRLGIKPGDRIEFLQAPGSTDMIIRLVQKGKRKSMLLRDSSVNRGQDQDMQAAEDCQR